MRSLRLELPELYRILYDHYGPQGWWPVDKEYHRKNNSDPREEIVIGAILTQNTSWKNVAKALENLKKNSLLSFRAIIDLPLQTLEELIKPSGYYRLKAKRLKEVCKALIPVEKVASISRDELLSIRGIGPETADAILLYAGDRPFFVIDAYTARIMERAFGISGGYEELRSYFENNLPQEVELFKEFHALLDRHAKQHCRKKPLCDGCPLTETCRSAPVLSL